MSLVLRAAIPADIPAIAAIYGHHVLTGSASFETEAPSESEMRARFDAIREKGFPYLAAELDGRVVGYAYATLYRTRPAYRFALEDSIYIHPEYPKRGIGRALLERLIADCEALGIRQLIAVIGDSGNAASIGLHAALGFRNVGTFEAVGWKHGRWVDSVLMQRSIGTGATAAP